MHRAEVKNHHISQPTQPWYQGQNIAMVREDSGPVATPVVMPPEDIINGLMTRAQNDTY